MFLGVFSQGYFFEWNFLEVQKQNDEILLF